MKNPKVVVSASTKKCFISVGFPENPGKGVYEKVLFVLKKGEDPIDIAEKFRARVAMELTQKKGKTYNVQDLYFLIFNNYVDKVPALASRNATKQVISLKVKEKYQVQRRNGKSLFAAEMIEKGLATKPQNSKIGGYQVKEVTIDEWKESEQVSEFIKNDLKKNMIDSFETKVKNAGFAGVGINPANDLLKAIEDPILSEKELIVVGHKIEKEMKNATRKSRQIK